MPLEDANFISELNPVNPPNTDPVAQGASQIRVTKKAVFQSFPNIDAEVSATAADLNTLVGAAGGGVLVPLGAILPYVGPGAPNGYLLCDGAVIDGLQWPDLVALVGPNTPDLRGQFLRGWSVNASVDPDGPRAPLAAQGELFKAHSHVVSANANGNTPFTGQQGSLNRDMTAGILSGDTGGTETRPVNVAVAFIIKG